ncbi:MAG: hypothetical protein LBR25_01035, partial [Erysipelotrichaceae bacterium]|nr:hypothetical protein [Erysipelotrichaceae bacterium]
MSQLRPFGDLDNNQNNPDSIDSGFSSVNESEYHAAVSKNGHSNSEAPEAISPDLPYAIYEAMMGPVGQQEYANSLLLGEAVNSKPILDPEFSSYQALDSLINSVEESKPEPSQVIQEQEKQLDELVDSIYSLDVSDNKEEDKKSIQREASAFKPAALSNEQLDEKADEILTEIYGNNEADLQSSPKPQKEEAKEPEPKTAVIEEPAEPTVADVLKTAGEEADSNLFAGVIEKEEPKQPALEKERLIKAEPVKEPESPVEVETQSEPEPAVFVESDEPQQNLNPFAVEPEEFKAVAAEPIQLLVPVVDEATNKADDLDFSIIESLLLNVGWSQPEDSGEIPEVLDAILADKPVQEAVSLKEAVVDEAPVEITPEESAPEQPLDEVKLEPYVDTLVEPLVEITPEPAIAPAAKKEPEAEVLLEPFVEPLAEIIPDPVLPFESIQEIKTEEKPEPVMESKAETKEVPRRFSLSESEQHYSDEIKLAAVARSFIEDDQSSETAPAKQTIDKAQDSFENETRELPDIEELISAPDIQLDLKEAPQGIFFSPNSGEFSHLDDGLGIIDDLVSLPEAIPVSTEELIPDFREPEVLMQPLEALPASERAPFNTISRRFAPKDTSIASGEVIEETIVGSDAKEQAAPKAAHAAAVDIDNEIHYAPASLFTMPVKEPVMPQPTPAVNSVMPGFVETPYIVSNVYEDPYANTPDESHMPTPASYRPTPKVRSIPIKEQPTMIVGSWRAPVPVRATYASTFKETPLSEENTSLMPVVVTNPVSRMPAGAPVEPQATFEPQPSAAVISMPGFVETPYVVSNRYVDPYANMPDESNMPKPAAYKPTPKINNINIKLMPTPIVGSWRAPQPVRGTYAATFKPTAIPTVNDSLMPVIVNNTVQRTAPQPVHQRAAVADTATVGTGMPGFVETPYIVSNQYVDPYANMPDESHMPQPASYRPTPKISSISIKNIATAVVGSWLAPKPVRGTYAFSFQETPVLPNQSLMPIVVHNNVSLGQPAETLPPRRSAQPENRVSGFVETPYVVSNQYADPYANMPDESNRPKPAVYKDNPRVAAIAIQEQYVPIVGEWKAPAPAKRSYAFVYRDTPLSNVNDSLMPVVVVNETFASKPAQHTPQHAAPAAQAAPVKASASPYDTVEVVKPVAKIAGSVAGFVETPYVVSNQYVDPYANMPDESNMPKPAAYKDNPRVGSIKIKEGYVPVVGQWKAPAPARGSYAAAFKATALPNINESLMPVIVPNESFVSSLAPHTPRHGAPAAGQVAQVKASVSPYDTVEVVKPVAKIAGSVAGFVETPYVVSSQYVDPYANMPDESNMPKPAAYKDNPRVG